MKFCICQISKSEFILYQKNLFSLSSTHTEAASILTAAEGGREICADNPRYTLSTASSGRISPLESPVTVKVENQCGAPDPSLRLRLCSGWQKQRHSEWQKTGWVQDDKRRLRLWWQGMSFWAPLVVILSTSRCHSEQSEESGEEGQDNGPRTSQICILLKYRLL